MTNEPTETSVMIHLSLWLGAWQILHRNKDRNYSQCHDTDSRLNASKFSFSFYKKDTTEIQFYFYPRFDNPKY